MVAPTLKACVLGTGIAIIALFEFFALFGLAIGLCVVDADSVFAACVCCAWITVVTVGVVFTIFRAIDGEMQAFSCDCVAAIGGASVVIVTLFAHDTELSVAR